MYESKNGVYTENLKLPKYIHKSLLLKKLFLTLFIVLLFKPLWVFDNQNLVGSADELSYWLHASTLAFDYDIDYKTDFDIDSKFIHPQTNVPFHPPGSGYASSPFVFLFSLLDKFNNNSDLQRINPTGTYSYLGFYFATLFYALVGFILLTRILNFKGIKVYPIIFITVFTSTLVHFVFTRFLMSHAFEFFLCCLLFYIFEKNENIFSTKIFVLLSVTYFLLAITRPSTFLFSLALLTYYHDKFTFKKGLEALINVSILSLLVFLYISLSMKLYNTPTILLNLGRNTTTSDFASDLNINWILSGILKFPKLLLSNSMGLIWCTPIIVFAMTITFFNRSFFKNFFKIKNLSIFLYFFGAFLVSFVWQGRELAYGQRLFIGLLPFAALKCSEFKKYKLKIIVPFTVISYLGYLYYYTPNLTLVNGKTLWGTTVAHSLENYFLNLLTHFYKIENIFAVFFKSIFSVDLFSIFSFNKFSTLINKIYKIPGHYLSDIIFYTDIYNNLQTGYLLIANFLIFGFSYLFVSLIMNEKNKFNDSA